ncbi:uncharacterized protein OCT59_023393 [Rhizophagus irregularis]|nr:hypothetical protein OCT59_023393 [Rhizophagus irregularis]
MTSDITNEINSPEYDKPHTPPHQIRSTSENQDLIKLRNWPEAINRLVVSTDEAVKKINIKSLWNILVDRLKIKRDYKWDPVINNATNYIDELINNHYEIHWVHRFADKLSLFFEAPRNPLLDKNSEVHRGEEMSLASIERKNMTREDTEKKRSGHKIDILFRIDNMEYFGSETYTDEDPDNSKPINYKHNDHVN